jgi:succinate-semialdehyde dehydrogenase / glutarate-semialdehyde dehydrogenase
LTRRQGSTIRSTGRWRAAQVILGGKRPSADSAFFEPTILTNVEKGTPAYDEELFGPVAAVMTVPDEETTIAVANDTKYGLGGSVYTRDLERGRRVADQIDAGMVYVNHPAWIYEDVPFGGIKRWGYGRETGPLGIQGFVNKKLFREPEIVEKKFLIVPDLHNPLL